jgi:HAE1 family hydrophobic/amphiphilic exporter-1
MEKLVHKFTKGAKIDYEELMVADSEHKKLVDGFNPDHTL